MASITRKKGEKNWSIQFYFNGKKYYKSLRVSKKRDALKIKQHVERLLALGEFDPDTILRTKREVLKLSDLIQKWHQHLDRRKDLSPGSVYQYRQASEIMTEIVDDILLRDVISLFVIDDLRANLEDKYESAGTVKNKMASMRAMFSFALKRGMVEVNPFLGNLPSLQRRKPVFFRKDEIRAIIDYFSGDVPQWQRTYFLTMLNTGNRKSEHLALTWSENVFLDDALLKFLGKGRNEGKERIVPLNDVAIRLFRSAHRKLGEDRVFWQAKSKYTVDSAWQSAREKIGVPYKIHHFRSNRASHLVMAGIPVEKVMRIMGWEDYETYKIYAGLSDDFLKGDRNAVSFE